MKKGSMIKIKYLDKYDNLKLLNIPKPFPIHRFPIFSLLGRLSLTNSSVDIDLSALYSQSYWDRDANGEIYPKTITDKVGIGTSDPSTKLHIIGNAAALRLEGTDHTYMEFYPDGGTTRKGYFGYPASSTDGIALYTEGTNYLKFGTNSAERIRILSTGEVGIGETAPDSRLEVSGRIHAIHSEDTEAVLWLEHNGDDYGYGIYQNIDFIFISNITFIKEHI